MKKRELKGIENRKNVSVETRKGYVDTLKKMIDYKSIFTDNFENQSEFDKFYKVIEECFPNLCAKAEKLTFGSGCFVYVIFIYKQTISYFRRSYGRKLP